jgi:rod shape-determining protein MreD
VPPVPVANIKLPCLLSVCVYYAVRREPGYGFAAALWCGVMQDGLDSIPYGVSALSFCLITALCIVLVKKQMPDNTVSCVLVAVAGGVLIEVLQYGALMCSGQYAALPGKFLMIRLLIFVAVTIPVTAIVAGLVRLMDTLSANAGLDNDNGTLGWNAN